MCKCGHLHTLGKKSGVMHCISLPAKAQQLPLVWERVSVRRHAKREHVLDHRPVQVADASQILHLLVGGDLGYKAGVLVVDNGDVHRSTVETELQHLLVESGLKHVAGWHLVSVFYFKK